MAEQSIIFNQNIKNKEEFEAFLIFGFMVDDGHEFEGEVPISCGEDLEDYMKSFFNKKWKDLLPEHMQDIRVISCTIEGIHMKGKQEKGRFTTYLTNNYKRNTIIVNEKALINESAEKLLKIRNIILS